MENEFLTEYLEAISKLYPSLNEDQVKEAAGNIMRFTELILQIYERIKSDPEAYAQFKALTGR